ncbi:MAG TPA: hypothetical protein VNF68_00880 [Candidatus Baltobacteraceae bacterium]|nr:hypothetical protein [Candidatus Baltobacteraceae bacterium]
MRPAHDVAMMTQQLEVSLICAPLAAIDRRALSQAWYSALHVTAAPPARIEPPAPAMPATRNCARIARPHPRTATAMPDAPVSLRAHREAVAPRATGSTDRRAVRSLLARQIEREFLRPLNPVRRATFSIEGRAARVHVALQDSRSGLRLIAVCSPGMREVVTRALEEARYALARRGIALAPVIEEARPCS